MLKQNLPGRPSFLSLVVKNKLQKVPGKMYLRNELINLRSTLLKILALTDHFSSPKGQFITNSAPVFNRAFYPKSI